MNMFQKENFFLWNYLQTMWNSVRYKCDKNNKHWGNQVRWRKKQPSVQQRNRLISWERIKALDEFPTLNQNKWIHILAKASVAALDHHGVLAQHAIETGHGVFEVKQSPFACEHGRSNMRHTKTASVVSDDEGNWINLISWTRGVVSGIYTYSKPQLQLQFSSVNRIKNT